MRKRLIPIGILILYAAFLIKVMVFKDMPTIRIGQLMLNFGGAESGHPANFIPFKTIIPYLLGYKGWIIAGVNLVGNIAPLIPLGFIFPFIYRNITWKKTLVLAVVSSLVIEVMQTVLHVGIFDIDDVILNVLGVMIGYWMFLLVVRWVRARKYAYIVAMAVVILVASAAAAYAIYPHGQPLVIPDETKGDLCGGTGGNGQIVSIGNKAVTMRKTDGGNQVIHFTGKTTVRTSPVSGSVSDLKVGDRITLVGGPNPDGSFTADAVFVCSAPAVKE